MTASEHECPVCAHTEFKVYNKRLNALCSKCGALERGRLAWMVLKAHDLVRPGVRILNLAPEPFMISLKASEFGGGYEAADYDPSLFAKWKKPVRAIDLCSDPEKMPEGSFDVIMHNHVLEHVPCDVSKVLRDLNRLLVPGGYHLLSAPIMPNRVTKEDLNPSLTPEERRARFGQEDHMRIFGDLDFMSYLDNANMTEGLVNYEDKITENDLTKAALPSEILKSVNSHRIFLWQKPLQ